MSHDGAVPGLLDGVRVLDLSIWRPGPYCTQLLVELGADVVKVEPPGGDPMRVFPPLFAELNAGKRAAVVDLKSGDGRAAVVGLARGARVVVEGFRPGVAARLGVGADDLLAANPSLVYCSISGYGQDGPLAAVPGHDVNYQARAGVLDPPHLPKPPLADLAGGAYAAMAICAALVRGEGEVIDVSMTEVLASWTGSVGPLLGGRVAGYGLYEVADGWLSLGVLSEDHLWAALATAVGLDDVAGLDFEQRTAAVDELEARLAAALAGRGRDELAATLADAGVPVAPVLDQAEMLADRGLVVDGPPMPHPLRYRHRPAGRPDEVPPLSEELPGWVGGPP